MLTCGNVLLEVARVHDVDQAFCETGRVQSAGGRQSGFPYPRTLLGRTALGERPRRSAPVGDHRIAGSGVSVLSRVR